MFRQVAESVSAPDQTCDLVDWPHDASQRLYNEPFVCRHRLQERELFSDAALAALLDLFPREHLLLRPTTFPSTIMFPANRAGGLLGSTIQVGCSG